MIANLARALRDLFTAMPSLQFGTFTAEPKWRGTLCISWVGDYDDARGFHGPREGVALTVGRRGFAVIWG